MLVAPALHPLGRFVWPEVLCAAALLALSACSSARPQAQEPAVAALTAERHPSLPRPVEAGDRFERVLGPSGHEEVDLNFDEGRYVWLQIDQSQVETKVALATPAGELLAEADLPRASRLPEELSFITPVAGTYRLIVTAPAPPREAVRLAVDVVALRPRRPDDGDRIVAEAALRTALGLRWHQGADWQREALALGKKAYEIFAGLGDTGRQIEAALEVGNAYRFTDAAQALTWFDDVLRIADVEHFPSLRARVLRNLGDLWRFREPERSRQYFEGALEIWTSLGSPAGQADNLYGIGLTYAHQGSDSKALAFYERALPLAQSAQDPELENGIWNAVSVAHSNRGDTRQAMTAAERALEVARSCRDLSGQAAALTSIGNLSRRGGQLQQAHERLTEALAINSQLGYAPDIARVLGHLGAVYVDLGEPQKALDVYQRARAVRQAEGMSQAQTLYQIGVVYLALLQPAAASAHFEAARTDALAAKSPRQVANAWHGIGLVRLSSKEFGEAAKALEQALPLRERSGDRFGEAMTRLELGRAYQGLGEVEKGATQIRSALDIARATEASFVQAAALQALARLDRDRANFLQAAAEIQEAIRILESVRADLPADRLRSSFFAAKRTYYDLYVDILMRLEDRVPGQGHAAKALLVSEAARARSLLDLLAEGRLEVTKGIDPQLRQREKEIASQLSQIQSQLIDELSAENPKGLRIETLRDQLSQVEESRLDLEQRIRSAHRRYASVRYPQPLDLSQIREHLDEQSALLEYAVGEDASYLFVVTRENHIVARLPALAAIEPLTLRLRASLVKADRNTRNDFPFVAHQLYELLVAPARAALAGKSRLLIAPDGPLYVVPFEALLTAEAATRDPAAMPYLLREFALGYIPSASVLPWLAEPPSSAEIAVPRKRFLAFADPIYPRETSASAVLPSTPPAVRGSETVIGELQRLPETELEVEDIAGGYARDEYVIYRRGEATEANVKENPLVAAARTIHFATHGVLDEERPELSGLVLTRSGERDDDGLLQTYEIFNLELSADLVVLSACETGMGKQVTGEGLIGMSRAFLYAGAPRVVVSLWRVRDDSARQVMVRFYEALERTGDKAQALREAKLSLIGGEFPHPAHWAPFILFGLP